MDFVLKVSGIFKNAGHLYIFHGFFIKKKGGNYFYLANNEYVSNPESYFKDL